MKHKNVRIPMAKGVPSKAAWSVAISSILIGLFWLFPRVQLLIAPVSDGSLLDSWGMPISYFSAALFGAYIIALLGALCGLRMASVALVCLLFVMAVMAVFDNVVVIRYTLELSGSESLLRSSRNLWELSGSVRWLLWFLFNYWFFIKRGANPQEL